MAWWAECKRRNWRRIVGLNMITYYSNELYKEWWNSLTDEQREFINKRKEEKSQKAIEDFNKMCNLVTYLYRRCLR